ncbi:MAG: putative mannitol operon repressor [Rhodospirillales bacterium]|nr:putative mannitol operon repressor [Rhodospirillales bacterium]
MREEDIKDLSAFLKEFQGETDRGAALVGAAVIDERLGETLRAFMVSDKAASPLLDGGSAPLGNFSARIEATFALGLISEHEHRECHLIRRVRNEFAHRTHGVTFSDKKISQLCSNLQSDLPGGRDAFVGKPRSVFINSVVLVSTALTYRAEWVARERRITRTWS